MEERLQKALEFANYRQTLNNQLHKIKIRAEGLLIFAKNGGNFNVNQELICFLDYLVRTGITETSILDSDNIPVQIADVAEFLKEITRRYFEVTDDYLKEYQDIRKLRNVKSIVDLKDDE
jgi:predicted HTH transcriptional regulator